MMRDDPVMWWAVFLSTVVVGAAFGLALLMVFHA